MAVPVTRSRRVYPILRFSVTCGQGACAQEALVWRGTGTSVGTMTGMSGRRDTKSPVGAGLLVLRVRVVTKEKKVGSVFETSQRSGRASQPTRYETAGCKRHV